MINKLKCFLGLHKWKGVSDLGFVLTGKIQWYQCIYCKKNKY